MQSYSHLLSLRLTRRTNKPAKRIYANLLKRAVLLCFAVLAAGRPTPVLAGGGPENVLLVVNPRSAVLADNRQPLCPTAAIPSTNVLFVPWNPESRDNRHRHLPPTDSRPHSQDDRQPATCGPDRLRGLFQRFSLGDFLGQRFPPVFGGDAAGGRRKAGGAPPTSPAANRARSIRPPGPMASVPYAGRLAQRADLSMGARRRRAFRSICRWTANAYMRRPIPQQRDAPAAGFRGNRHYNQQGRSGRLRRAAILALDDARRDRRARQFAREVLDYLRRSAKADGTQSERHDLFRPKTTTSARRSDMNAFPPPSAN